ncbi:hypothetical protein ACFL21_01380 [Patescibacteria group bacterium]
MLEAISVLDDDRWDDCEYAPRTRDTKNKSKERRQRKILINRAQDNDECFDSSDCDELSFQDLQLTLAHAHIPNSDMCIWMQDLREEYIQTPYYIDLLRSHFDHFRIFRDKNGKHRVEITDESVIDRGYLFKKLDHLKRLPSELALGGRLFRKVRAIKGSTDILKPNENHAFATTGAICKNIEESLDRAYMNEFDRKKRRKMNRQSRSRITNRADRSSQLRPRDIRFSLKQAVSKLTPSMRREFDSDRKCEDNKLLRILERVIGRSEISEELLLALNTVRDATMRSLFVKQGGYKNSRRAIKRREAKLFTRSRKEKMCWDD